uniref:ATPase subunit 8 n=1 Tax=Aplidium conicum TaxID=286149 RepID=D1GKZ8_APLCO|nr:ATP synthase F0 subunit 8 [Aplidium conicum]CAX68852.1 ATPase subunit 8 [Aplidium conicum]
MPQLNTSLVLFIFFFFLFTYYLLFITQLIDKQNIL